ncbi:MAG: phage holin family protein [Xenococcaceae cyanobacterium MO_188.B29]|nr:phage holin family protein [Xenococcaceae cyanobacterium MO_188.B29]
MSNIHAVFVAFIVTIVSLLIIFKLPLGIKIDDARKGFITAVIFAIIDAVSYPALAKIGLSTELVPFELFSLVINSILLAIAGFIVPGFRLRWGIWSIVICAFALSVIDSLIFNVLPFKPVSF